MAGAGNQNELSLQNKAKKVENKNEMEKRWEGPAGKRRENTRGARRGGVCLRLVSTSTANARPSPL